jgi:dethiobiotin synthetase
MRTVSTGALVVVTGTGTGVGKTHLACALATLARSATTPRGGAVVAAWKPIESGVGSGATDHGALLEASSFHVKQDLALAYGLVAPVSPYLAASLEGAAIDLAAIVRRTNHLRVGADLVLVELPGGLFTPLTEEALNADLVRALAPTATVLVAPDRLGVLHDVLAAASAAGAAEVQIAAVALTSLARGPADASAGTNASELRRRLGLHIAEIPYAPVFDLVSNQSVKSLLAVAWSDATFGG